MVHDALDDISVELAIVAKSDETESDETKGNLPTEKSLWD